MEKQLISGTSLACKNICLKKFSKEDLQDHLEYLKRKNKYSDKDWLYNLRGIIERLIGKQCDAYHQVEEIIKCAIDKVYIQQPTSFKVCTGSNQIDDSWLQLVLFPVMFGRVC